MHQSLASGLETITPNDIFFPYDGEKNAKSSIRKYINWMDERGLHWTQVDLTAYRDYLLNDTDLARSTAKKHMERVRARYMDLLNSNIVRVMIQERIPANATPADAYAITEEFLTRLRNNTQYDKRVAIRLPINSSFVDGDFRWLSRDEIATIMRTMPYDTKIGLRDAAIFALIYSFGLREGEACAVTVDNLRQTKNGYAGVLIENGKSMKRRFVLRDELTDYTGVIELWLQRANITKGLVLGGLKPRQLHNRVKAYSEARPHDFRRTYAKHLHEGGRTIEYIAQQLGHVKLETTLIYLGMIGG
jgi:site-specific recombinase XerD